VDYTIQHAQTTAQIKKAFGIDSPPLLDSLALSGDMMLVFTTPTFQPAAHLLDKSVRFVGPSIEARPQASDFPFDHLRDQPVVFISLGTVFDNQPEFYQNCFTAFADRDYAVVMTIGNRVNPMALGEIPANFMVRNFVPQLEVLKYTDVFITHGGLGSVHEALYFGVPMVLFPQMFEQSVNAQRVAQCGAGLPLRVVTTDAQPPTMVSPQELRQAVEQVLENPRFKWNAQRVGEEFLRYNPVHTAEIVQQFVGTPLPMRV
jgi:MGT family glycosyltransferase